MPMFMCRWPDGRLSFVYAADEDDAICRLDEWDNAELAELTRIKDFMIDLALTDEGELKAQQFGDRTSDIIWEKAFPHVGAARDEPSVRGRFELTPAGKDVVRQAIRTEKSRPLRIKKRKGVETEIGKEIQKQLGAPAAAVNRHLKEAASDQLAKMPSNGRKQ